jgi:predicted DNA-binding transcriptional regulator YafY
MRNDPTGRALQLLSLLQTQRFWGSAELAARLEITERTVRRDVDRLRALGYPVDSTPGKYGGYRLEAGADLPPLVVDDDEAVAIAVGLRYAAHAAIDGIEETSLRALTKIESLLPHRLRRRVSALHSNVSSTRRSADDEVVDPEALSVLAAACRDGEHVRVDYRRRDGESSSRLLEPHRLVTSGRRWYLVAWDTDRRDWRTFRLDRLRRPRPTTVRFTPRDIPGGDAATFVARSVAAASLTREVTLALGAPAAAFEAPLRWIDHTVL